MILTNSEQTNIFELLHNTFKLTKPIRLIELFAGYGSQAIALEKLKSEGLLNFENHKVIEFDKYAIKSYNTIHNTHFEVSDIQNISANDLNIINTSKYDYLMTYSFPCQDLSKAGKQKGMNKEDKTRSGLLWEVERILDECDKLPQVLLMENVPDVIGTKNIKNFQQWRLKLEQLGYSNYVECLNSKNFGVPQNRERCFMISILGNYYYYSFPNKFKLDKRLKDILEQNVEQKYYVSEAKIKFMKETAFRCSSYDIVVHNENDIARTLCARDYKDPKCVKVGELTGGKWDKTYELGKRLYSDSEISPTITTMGGGNQEPKILLENLNKLIMTEATKKGYAIANIGDGVYINRPHQKRGVVQKGMIQTLKTSCNDVGVVVNNKSIRKLTPREHGRLMGLDDENITKMLEINSNTQCYKQFGNSIVVDVLYHIFKQMVERRTK